MEHPENRKRSFRTDLNAGIIYEHLFAFRFREWHRLGGKSADLQHSVSGEKLELKTDGQNSGNFYLEIEGRQNGNNVGVKKAINDGCSFYAYQFVASDKSPYCVIFDALELSKFIEANKRKYRIHKNSKTGTSGLIVPFDDLKKIAVHISADSKTFLCKLISRLDLLGCLELVEVLIRMQDSEHPDIKDLFSELDRIILGNVIIQ